MEKNYNKEIYIDNFYNNYKFEKLTTEKIIKIEKIEKLDNYKNVKSFSQLFNKPRQSLRQQISNLSPQEQALLYQFVQQ